MCTLLLSMRRHMQKVASGQLREGMGDGYAGAGKCGEILASGAKREMAAPTLASYLLSPRMTSGAM